MSRVTSFTMKLEGGVKRETRVRITRRSLKWQFKRSDEDAWDYDSAPTPEDWDALEDILGRRERRGRSEGTLADVQRLRTQAGA